MPKKTTVAEYIQAQLEVCGKSQREVAEEAGFPKPNMLTMVKQGATKLPIARVNALADALGVNRANLMKLVLSEYHPEILEAFEHSIGEVLVDE